MAQLGSTKVYGDLTITGLLTVASEKLEVNNSGIKLENGTTINEFSTDGTLAGDSDTAVPTEKAVKTYVDNNAGGFADPMTTRGDIIYKDSSNTTTRLAVGTNGQVLTSDGTDISWETPAAVSNVPPVPPVSVQNESPYITNLDTADVWLSQVMNKGGVSSEWQTYTSGATHGEGSGAFLGGVLTPSGKVILVPYNSDNIGIYDPETDTYTSGATHGEGSGAFFGGVLTPSGKVIFVPRDSDNVGIYDTLNEISLGTALSPLLNKY